MNGKNNDVLSFLDSLEKNKLMQDAMNASNNDPDIKLRRLQATKNAGKIECLRYIFRDLCKRSIPDIGSLNPGGSSGSAPDLDHIIDKVMSSRTGGNDFAFYVKEALKRDDGQCFKTLTESVNKLINKMYYEKDIHPETISDSDFEFKISPQVEDRLQKIISDNQLDALSEVIKDNVKADAVDEITAAKKEREDRMKLEEELMNDPSVTSEATLDDALRKKGYFNAREVYQPTLFESVMVNAFNSADNGSVSVGSKIELPSQPAECPNMISIMCGMDFDTMEDGDVGYKESQVKVTAAVEKMLRVLVNRYYSNVDKADMGMVIPAFDEQVKNIKVDSSQQMPVVDIEVYREVLRDYRDTVAASMKGDRVVPSVSSAVVPEELRNIPAIMRKAYESCVDMVHDLADPDFVTKYVNTIPVASVCTALGVRDAGSISSLARLCAAALATKLEYFNACLNILINGVECAKRVNAVVTDTAAKSGAFNAAVYEYTVLNVLKALKTESFDPDEVKAIARSYVKTN